MTKHTTKGSRESPTLTNRKAGHNFEILERIEAGIALKGSEVKSLRLGQASLAEAFARIEGQQVMLHNFQIQPYPQAGPQNHDPKRIKPLLLHRREIQKLATKVRIRGQTLIPLRVYFSEKGMVKVELALARGRKLHDKRQDERKKQDLLDISRAERRGRR